jgi:hypothetical protein
VSYSARSVVNPYFSADTVSGAVGAVTWSADVIFTALLFMEQQPPSDFVALTVLNVVVEAVPAALVEHDAASLSVSQLLTDAVFAVEQLSASADTVFTVFVVVAQHEAFDEAFAVFVSQSPPANAMATAEPMTMAAATNTLLIFMNKPYELRVYMELPA